MFFKKAPELTYKEIVTGLKKLGFKKEPSKSIAHEQWKVEGPFRLKKVTVEKHPAPFDKELVHAMAKQAGVPVREFCRLCKDKKYRP